jgi:hypothetical protein
MVFFSRSYDLTFGRGGNRCRFIFCSILVATTIGMALDALSYIPNIGFQLNHQCLGIPYGIVTNIPVLHGTLMGLATGAILFIGSACLLFVASLLFYPRLVKQQGHAIMRHIANNLPNATIFQSPTTSKQTIKKMLEDKLAEYSIHSIR